MATKTKRTAKTTKTAKPAPKAAKTTKATKTAKAPVAVKKEETRSVASRPATPMKFKRSYVSLVIGILVVAGLIYLFRSFFVVAMVNGQPISRMAFSSEVEKQAGKQALNTLITKTLIMQEAKKQHVDISKQEVDAEIKKIEDNLAKQGTKLDTALQVQGMTRNDLADQIKYQKLIEKIVGKDIKVTDQEVEKYITDNKDSLPTDQKPEDLKKDVAERIKQQKLSEKVQAWLADLQKNAKITYFIQQ